MSNYKKLHVIVLQTQLISGDINREPGTDNADTVLLSSFSVHIRSTGLIFWAETILLLSFSVQTQLHFVSFPMPISHFVLFSDLFIFSALSILLQIRRSYTPFCLMFDADTIFCLSFSDTPFYPSYSFSIAGVTFCFGF